MKDLKIYVSSSYDGFRVCAVNSDGVLIERWVNQEEDVREAFYEIYRELDINGNFDGKY